MVYQTVIEIPSRRVLSPTVPPITFAEREMLSTSGVKAYAS